MMILDSGKIVTVGRFYRDARYLPREVVKNKYGRMALTPIRLDPECGRAKYKAVKKTMKALKKRI